MRPERLKIRNFLGIVEADIKFTDRNVFAILGDNGAGKSSILEAMYFALFGETLRFGGKEKRSAINRHSTEEKPKAIVEFTFSNASSKYRIKRVIYASKQSTTSILEKLSPMNTTFTRDIDKEIRKLIQVDKEIFKKTILLPQGEMTGFISSRKAETVKNILTGIFGISTLSEIKKIVSQKHSEVKGKYEEKQSRVEALSTIGGRILEDALNESKSRIKEAEREAKRLKEAINKLNQEIQTTINLLATRKRIQEKEAKIRQKEAEIKELSERVKEDELIEKIRTIKPYYEILEEKGKRINDVRKAIKETTEKIEELERNKSEIEKRLQKIKERLNTYELCRPLHKQFTELLQAIKTNKTNKGKIEHSLWKEQKEAESLKLELTRLIEKKKDLPYSERELLIMKLKKDLQVGDKCPICGNTIENLEAHRNHIDTETLKTAMELETNIEKLKQEIQSYKKVILSLEEQANNLSLEITRQEEELKGLQDEIEKKTGILAKQFQENLEKLTKQKNAYENAYIRAETTLENLKKTAEEYQKALQTFINEHEKEKLRFDSKFKQAGIDQDTFLKYKDREPTDAKKRVQQLQTEIQQLKTDIASEKSLVDTETPISEVERLLKQREDEKSEKETKLEEVAKLQGSLRKEIENIQNRIEELEELKEQVKKVEREYITTRKLNYYLESNRFPAYVSDYYLNAIVERANHILFRFFSGKYTLSTQNSELRIIDKNLPDNDVSIDSLSGGEKVLVSMAIAMAITELTTNHIDMLFIDEGFSPLDNNNIQEVAKEIQLLESTNKVIGIVTHNQDFAEQFNHILKVENGRVEWLR